MSANNPLWPEPGPDATCQTCVWRKAGARSDRCLRHHEAVKFDWPACPAHTVELDCLTCGACCREAYHAVEVGPRDAFVRAHPELLARVDGRWNVLRTPENRCACLGSDYRCSVYGERPKTCRDFEKGGSNCVEARRRVGLTG